MRVQDPKKIGEYMIKIRLNEVFDNENATDEYILQPTKKYVIDIEKELDFQMAIMTSFRVVGPPPALKNYLRGYSKMGLM